MTDVDTAALTAEEQAEREAEAAAEALPQPDPQAAAEAALARAGQPPEALTEAEHAIGGPGDPGLPGEPGPVAHGQEYSEVERDVPEDGPVPEARAIGYAQRLAKSIHDDASGDVAAVADHLDETKQRVLYGEADETDFEAITEWLLSDEAEVNTRELRVRLGGSDAKPLIAPWFIRAVGVDVIRSAEREAAGNRAQRRDPDAPQYDELKANLRIVVEGTVGIGKPPWEGGLDCKTISQQKGLRDPTTWLQRKLQFRPGVIAMIAGQVMALSGFDQEDVQAAGKS